MLDVSQNQFPLPFMLDVNLWPPGSLMFGNMGSLGADASAAWPSANAAFYIPFRLPFRQTITGVVALNGTTVSGNIDVGIYDSSGLRLTSMGSTAQAGVSVGQTLDFANVTIGPGLYFLGIAMNNTTGHLMRWSLGVENAMGIMQQATAFPLPATATFTFNSVANAYLPNLVISGGRTHDDSVVGWPILGTLIPHSQEAAGPSLIGAGTGAMWTSASAVWPAANAAFVYPFVLTERTRIRRLFCFNGATVSGNIDMGIYGGASAVPVLLVSSGSIAQAGTNVIQSAAVDITLGPGRFAFALACSNTTATFRRNVATVGNNLTPAVYQIYGSSFPLGTLGAAIGGNYQPVCGISRIN